MASSKTAKSVNPDELTLSLRPNVKNVQISQIEELDPGEITFGIFRFG
jgi:hypothetical protein